MLVVGTAYEPFCERLAEAVKTIKIGPAEDPSTTMPPVVDRDAQARVLRYADIAKREGKLLGEQSVADNTIYAVTGGLDSRSPQNIARVRREMRVGNLYINRKITGAIVDRQPFGGARMSGVGSKAGGPDYLLQFLVPRTITESVMRRGFAPTED